MNQKTNFTDHLIGAEKVISRFGCWPSFHDAEITELVLRTGGVTELKLRPCSTGSTANTRENLTVVFELREIETLSLADFHTQNILLGLEISHEGESFSLILDGSTGLSGRITVKHVSVRVIED